MIPWAWIVGSAWVGGTTAMLASLVFAHQVAGDSRYTWGNYVAALFWPIYFPVLSLLASRYRNQCPPETMRAFRTMTDTLDQPAQLPQEESYVSYSAGFELCDACKRTFNVPYEYAATPKPCENCEAQWRAWQDNENAKHRARLSQLCESCKKGFGL